MTASAGPVIPLRGDPFEVGFQHGALVTFGRLSPALSDYSAAIAIALAAATPALSEEIAGLASCASLAAGPSHSPERRELHLRPGDPSRGSTQTIRIPPA